MATATKAGSCYIEVGVVGPLAVKLIPSTFAQEKVFTNLIWNFLAKSFLILSRDRKSNLLGLSINDHLHLVRRLQSMAC